MSAIRFRKKAEADFNNAFGMSDIVKALQLIGKWVGKPIEEEEIVRYDARTGDRRETGRFKPGEAWDGVLWLDSFGNSPSVGKEEVFYTSLLQAVKKGETVSFGVWIVQYVPARSEGGFGSMADQGGTIPEHIRIIKPRALK